MQGKTSLLVKFTLIDLIKAEGTHNNFQQNKI